MDELILIALGDNATATNTTKNTDKNSLWKSSERDNSEVVFYVSQKFQHWWPEILFVFEQKAKPQRRREKKEAATVKKNKNKK